MNDQDRDLIAALAQGDLSASAAKEATARIEADPELASEYANQLVALRFLESSTAPVMTAAERSTLHTNLTEQLGLTPVAPPAVVASKRKAQWWAPVFGFATAAAVVAAFVIFPNSSQDTFVEVGAELDGATESTSQSAPPSSASPQSSSASSDASGASPQTSIASQDSQDSAAIEESASALSPSVVQDGALSVYETNTVELDELLNEASGAHSPESVQRQLSREAFTDLVDLNSEEVNACLNDLDSELPDGIQEILVIGANAQDGQTIVHVGFDFGSGIEDGMSFVLESCEFVEHAPAG